MAFTKMKGADGSIISVNNDYLDQYKQQGYTTDLKAQLDYNKLPSNSVYRKENAELIGGAYIPQETFTNGKTIGGTGNTNTAYDQLNKFKYDSTIAALDKSKNNALLNIDAQKSEIQPKFYNAGLEARATSGQQARGLAEFIAQRGLQNSGVAVQGEINRQGALQNTLGQLGTDETKAYADIARNKTNILNNYQSDIASAKAEQNAQSLQDYINQNNRQQDIDLQQSNIDYNRQQDSKNEYSNTMDRFYENYQAEINKVQSDGDPTNDWQIPLLQAERQKKIRELAQIDAAQKAAEEKARAEKAQQDFENSLKQQTINYNTNKPYFTPKTNTTTNTYGLEW
jgi:hypothetical protein